MEMDQPTEVARLQAEVLELRTRLEAGRNRAFAIRSLRDVTAAVLAVLAAFSLVATVAGGWAARTVLDTDRWVATVAPLPKHPKVAAAVAQYASAEIFRVLDLDQHLRQALPQRAGFLVDPVAGQVQQYVRTTLTRLITTDRFQHVWIEANRRAHQRALAVLEDRGEVVRIGDDRVVIDLLPLVNQALRELGGSLPTLFDRPIDLPDLDSGAIPAGLRTAVESAVGVRLPADFAQFTVYDGGRLAALQQSMLAAKRDLALLAATTVLMLALTLLVSTRRRRSAVHLGVWMVVGAVAATATVRATRADLLAGLQPGVYRDGAAAAFEIVTARLREWGALLLLFGTLIAAVAYLAGPGRVAVRLRRAVAGTAGAARRGVLSGVRTAPGTGPAWIARHRDPLRLGGVGLAVVATLLISEWSGLLVVALALISYEVLVTAIGRAVDRTGTGRAANQPAPGRVAGGMAPGRTGVSATGPGRSDPE